MSAPQIGNFDEAACDHWHDGWFLGFRGSARPGDPDAAEGWREGVEARKVRPILMERPEGYYHGPIETEGRP